MLLAAVAAAKTEAEEVAARSFYARLASGRHLELLSVCLGLPSKPSCFHDGLLLLSSCRRYPDPAIEELALYAAGLLGVVRQNFQHLS